MASLMNEIQSKPTETQKLVSCRIPYELYEQAKEHCKKNKHTLTDIVKAGFVVYVKENSKKTK
jgi:hypothetical protein